MIIRIKGTALEIKSNSLPISEPLLDCLSIGGDPQIIAEANGKLYRANAEDIVIEFESEQERRISIEEHQERQIRLIGLWLCKRQ